MDSPNRFGVVRNSYCISIGAMIQSNIIIGAAPITSINTPNLRPFEGRKIRYVSSVHWIFSDPFPKSSIIKPYSDHHHTE
jgi:hypothetical protein